MKFRMFALLALLVMLAGIVPFAAAQDVPDLNCLDLSEADCAIVNAAMENTAKMQSFTQTFSFSQSLSGSNALLGATGGMDSATTAEGGGPIVIDFTQMKGEEPYKGVSMAFEVTGASGEDSGTVSFVIVDGIFYIQGEDGAWKGVAISELMQMEGMTVMGMDMSMMSPENMAGMAENPMAALGEMEMGDFNLQSVLEIPGFLKQERLADETVDGQNMAVFAYTADISALFQSEEVTTALSEAVAGMMSSGASSGQGGAMMQQMGAMLPVILESTVGEVTLTRWIGVDDQFAHRLELDVSATIDLFGGATSDNVTPIPPIEFKLNLLVDLTDINATTAPTAPEGATIVPVEEFMPNPEATPGM